MNDIDKRKSTYTGALKCSTFYFFAVHCRRLSPFAQECHTLFKHEFPQEYLCRNPTIPIVVRRQVALWSKWSWVCETGCTTLCGEHGKPAIRPAPNEESGWFPFTNTRDTHTKHMGQLEKKSAASRALTVLLVARGHRLHTDSECSPTDMAKTHTWEKKKN